MNTHSETTTTTTTTTTATHNTQHSLSGTGTDQHYVPLDQTTCFLLSFSRTGVACCLPACAQGLSVLVMENSGNGVLFGLVGFSLVFGAHGEC